MSPLLIIVPKLLSNNGKKIFLNSSRLGNIWVLLSSISLKILLDCLEKLDLNSAIISSVNSYLYFSEKILFTSSLLTIVPKLLSYFDNKKLWTMHLLNGLSLVLIVSFFWFSLLLLFFLLKLLINSFKTSLDKSGLLFAEFLLEFSRSIEIWGFTYKNLCFFLRTFVFFCN